MVMVVPRPRQQQDEVPAMASSADSAGPQQRRQMYNSSNSRQRRQGMAPCNWAAIRLHGILQMVHPVEIVSLGQARSAGRELCKCTAASQQAALSPRVKEVDSLD